MTTETLETIQTLLTSLLDETADAEVHYKLRTALQLLDVHDAEIERLEAAADDSPELEERLRELGYLE